MIENELGKRYAEALSETIGDADQLETALANLQAFALAYEADPRLSRFFIHPTISEEDKSAFVKGICDQIQAGDEVRTLLQMLVERQRILYVKNIADYFQDVVNERLNQVRVQVASAHPLNSENVEHLKSALHRILEKDILLELNEDESLLGGIRVSVGSLVADATVKNRLALLRRSLEKEEVLSESTSR